MLPRWLPVSRQNGLGAFQTPVGITSINPLAISDIPSFLALGLVGGAVAVGIMLLVAQFERGFTWAKCPPALRPVIGGLCVGGLALVTPQILSSGHGALELQFMHSPELGAIALLLVLKILASGLSLGSGFRGGSFLRPSF